VSWRSRVAHWLMKSDTTYKTPAAWLFDWLTGGGESSAGVRVGPQSAQGSSAVFACVQVRSQDIAKLPLILYRRMPDGSRKRANDHPLYGLLKRKPNSLQTSFEYRETQQAVLDLRGNAYSRIYRDARYRPVELVPLHDDWVTPVRSTVDGTPFYKVRMYGRGEVETLAQDDILHLRDRSDDGFVGKSCIDAHRARDVVGLDIAGATHAAKLFANGARPGGILSPKTPMEEGGRDRLEADWNAKFRGVENVNRVLVAADELTYTQVGMTNVDAEYILQRKLTRSEVASIFRVPPHKIGIMDNATFSNIEHQALEYVTDTLMPIARRWEEALGAALLRESEQEDYYFEFQFDALLRGDFLSRMQGYQLQRAFGRSYNEIAELENWPKVPAEKGGDERLVPLNYWPMGEKRPEKTATTPQDQPAPGSKSLLDLPDNVLRLPAPQGAHDA
jgi:HK97 family phage portal protein